MNWQALRPVQQKEQTESKNSHPQNDNLVHTLIEKKYSRFYSYSINIHFQKRDFPNGEIPQLT